MPNSLEVTDQESAAVATHPRVTLADIEAAIAQELYCRGHEIFDMEHEIGHVNNPVRKALVPLTICILVMKNGFTVIGKAAPASPENFNAEIGRKFAYEDAVRQLWPLMGYALKERLYHGW